MVKLFNYITALFMMILISWKGFEKAIESMETGDSPMNLPIPTHPFVFFMALGCGVMCIEFMRDILRTLIKSREKETSL